MRLVNPWLGGGVSTIGPFHAAKGQDNQDALGVARGGFGTVAVVCDGVGEARHARSGAHAACAAVVQSVRIWSAEPGAPELQLLRLIMVLWGLKIGAGDRADYATTCLFAFAPRHGHLLLGQLGDGMVLYRDGDGAAQTLLPERDDFLNVTTGLGVARRPTDWTVRRVDPSQCGLVVLMTDGVADDIEWETLGGFIDFMALDVVRPARRRRRWGRLQSLLENWPTEGNGDDKTVAALWRKADRIDAGHIVANRIDTGLPEADRIDTDRVKPSPGKTSRSKANPATAELIKADLGKAGPA